MINMRLSPRRVIALVTVLWLWLLCLSIFVFSGARVMNDMAHQEQQLDAGLKHLEAQLIGLAETSQVLQQRPIGVTDAELQTTRQAMEDRIALVEQALDGFAFTEDVQALRSEFEQVMARHKRARAPVPAQPRSTRPTVTKPVPQSLPFRVVGAELRAGQRSVSVAPAADYLTTEQIQVLLPGDAVGPWRLQAVESDTAVFQSHGQTRRLAIP